MEESEKRIRLHIGKMTCVNCQNKIETGLKRTHGIISARVSYSSGTADIVYDSSELTLKDVITVIENLDYEVLPERERQDITKVVCLLVIIVALYIMLQSTGILNLLVPSQLADTKMGYGMLFVIGLFTSVHCIAMCGGINLSQCIPREGWKSTERNSKLAVVRPALAYNMGRVFSYTAIGFMLGLAGFWIGGGSEVGLSTILQGILKIVAGLFMVITGINMLGLFPVLRKFSVRMPGRLAKKIGKEKARAGRPFAVGILNGFMPCGPLQSMWIVALATGSPFAGALSMLLFSLGTVPLMLGLGSIVSALGRKFADKVLTVGAILVVVLGLAMLAQGGSLSGWIPPDLLLVFVIAFSIAGMILSIPVEKKIWKNWLKAAALIIVFGSYTIWNVRGTLSQADSAADTEAEIVDGVQVVNSTLEIGRYPSITVQAGTPVKWIIDAPEGSINGCNYRMIISDYGIEYTFHTGENIIEFTPADTGTIRYSCWMGMIHGNIFVTDGTESAAAPAGNEAGGVSVPTPAGYAIPTDRIAVAELTVDEKGNEFQEVSTALTDDGFSPAVIVVQSNLAVLWNLDIETSDAESGVDLLAPSYSTKLCLGEGINQLSLYAQESFEVSTGDNRYYCYIKVVDDLAAVDEEAVKEEVAAFETLIYPQEVFESSGMSCCGG